MVNIFSPAQNGSKNAHISSFDQYNEIYNRSIEHPEKYWAEIAQRLDWMEPWASVREFDFVNGQIEWFSGGKLNASYNCIDRHIKKGHGDETAIIWEGNDPNQSRKFTYNELLKEVYINLLDQKEPKLNLESTEIFDLKFKDNLIKKNDKLRKIIKHNSEELKLHRNYLESHLQKNFFD